MGVKHSSTFADLCNKIRADIKECDIATLKQAIDSGNSVVVDVREDCEWVNGHLPNAVHIGKGVIERDIEKHYPRKDTEIFLYCGGGYRSVLAADNLQKMGYQNVISVNGGFRGWREAGYDIVTDES